VKRKEKERGDDDERQFVHLSSLSLSHRREKE
jgi:hypothetical protein